jgi:4-amino-4-deoxy-L-arabinose transferase-like glycosyltransferase
MKWRATRAMILLLWALAVGFALLRLFWLDADPPGYLVDDFITDEGWYAHAARNHALFGQWVMDEHNVALVLCPLHTLALRRSYAIFGVSFWSTRLVGAIASVLTVVLVGWRLRRSPVSAATAAALVATQPILFSLARVAYCESLQLLFVTAVWFFASDHERRSRSWFMAGAAAGLAVFAKASAVYVPVLALAAPFVTAQVDIRHRRVREMAWVVAGLGLVMLAFLPFELRFLDVLRIEQGREGSALWGGSGLPVGLFLPFVLGLHFRVGVLPGFWVGLFPLLVVFGVAAARLVVSLPLSQHARVPMRLAVGWSVLSLGFLCLRTAPAQPERYWANLLVPVACLAALACEPGLEPKTRIGRGSAWVAAALLAVGPALLVRQGILAGLVLALREPVHAIVRVRFMVPVMLLVGTALTFLLRRGRWPERVARGNALPVLTMAVTVVGAVAVITSLWSPTYTLRDASRALRAGFGSKVLTGDLANTLALETPFRAFPCFDLATMHLRGGWVNGDWRARGATHWIGDRPPGGKGWRPPPPAEAVLQSAYPIWPDAEGHPRITVYVSSLPSGAADRVGGDERRSGSDVERPVK